MTQQIPTIGRIVLYKLNKGAADQINKRRMDARKAYNAHLVASDGSVIHTGNDVEAGEKYPMIITRVWGATPDCAFNGQVLLDGNDTFWATSVHLSNPDDPDWNEGEAIWPPRA